MSSGGESEEIDELLGRVVLGRYRIVRELARGGMGAIYLARSEGAASFTRPVVIKRMLPEFVGDDAAARMFKREARIMALLRHPGIVSVYDFGREEHSYLLVMDYVHGFHLGRWVSWMLKRRVEVPLVLAVQIVIQVLEALQYAHALTGDGNEPLRIVHRDVSPSNVLLDVDGHVRLADFGIAQSGADAPDVKTTTRTVKGKFSYMAPEILDGGDPTPSGDVYSAAVVLHEILVGRNEFRTSNPTSTIGRVLTHVPTRLDVARTDCSPELADVVAMALLKDPAHRFETAAEFSLALRQVRGVPGEEADAMLAETIARDFRDPTLSSMFSLPSLEEIERSLRMPVAMISSHPPAPPAKRSPVPPQSRIERPSDQPTTGMKRAALLAQSVSASFPVDVSLEQGPEEGPSPIYVPETPSQTTIVTSRKGIPLTVVIGLVVLSIVGVGVGIWLVQDPSSTGPEVVYVQATPAGIDSTPVGEPVEPPTEAIVVDAGTQAATEVEPERTPERVNKVLTKRGEPSAAQEAAAIQRSFIRHTEAMHRCFAGGPPEAARELTLHFSINADGQVQRADLSPASAASTTAGQCVVRIARSIDFPRTSSPRSFRIPIEVRSR